MKQRSNSLKPEPDYTPIWIGNGTDLNVMLQVCGSWVVGGGNYEQHRQALEWAMAEGYIIHRTHHSEQYPAGVAAFEVTDKGLDHIRVKWGKGAADAACELREWHRKHSSKPPEPAPAVPCMCCVRDCKAEALWQIGFEAYPAGVEPGENVPRVKAYSTFTLCGPHLEDFDVGEVLTPNAQAAINDGLAQINRAPVDFSTARLLYAKLVDGQLAKPVSTATSLAAHRIFDLSEGGAASGNG